MWLHVDNTDSQRIRDLHQRRDLFVNRLLDFRRRERRFDAPEIGAVGITRMCTHGHIQLVGSFQRLLHGVCIAGMSAARDIGGSYVAHQLQVGAIGQRFLRLPKIGVNVDGKIAHSKISLNHCSCSRNA